jgi:hypothetical protein
MPDCFIFFDCRFKNKESFLLFTKFLKDNYVTPLTSIDGSGGFTKAFSSLIGSLLYGFANTDKFIKVDVNGVT